MIQYLINAPVTFIFESDLSIDAFKNELDTIKAKVQAGELTYPVNFTMNMSAMSQPPAEQPAQEAKPDPQGIETPEGKIGGTDQ